jgi:hypothetical protein
MVDRMRDNLVAFSLTSAKKDSAVVVSQVGANLLKCIILMEQEIIKVLLLWVAVQA